MERRLNLGCAIDPPQTSRDSPSYPRSLATAERMDIDRQGLDRGGIETAYPGGHYAGTAVGNSLHDSRLVETLEPDLIAEVPHSHLLPPLPRITPPHPPLSPA